MASLSAQIDRLTRNTRTIAAAATTTARQSAPFANAVLTAQLSDLIRDVDPSELGLFTLVKPQPSAPDPHLKRTQFSGATPLKRRPHRQDLKQEIQPEVYAHAALKYIDQYQPIRPMPRAYDQIARVMEKLKRVRQDIESLNNTLNQAAVAEDAWSAKERIANEESQIQDLQARVLELTKKKESATKAPQARTAHVHTAPPTKDTRISTPSPHEEKFWASSVEPSRTLRFADNLMDEEPNLGDVSAVSFGSPPSAFPEAAIRFADTADDITVTQSIAQQHFVPAPTSASGEEQQLDKQLSPVPPLSKHIDSLQPTKQTETPTSHKRRPKIDLELEKIIAKIWATSSDDILLPSGQLSPLPTTEAINYFESIASQTPSSDSPVASSATSLTAEGNSPPNVHQVLTAYLLILLLKLPPNYSMPLNQLKDQLATKAKTIGGGTAGQSTTRILYGCVAKRLVKIDRGGREQVVKFDV